MYLKKLDDEEIKDQVDYLINLSDVKDYKIDTLNNKSVKTYSMNMRNIY